MSLSYVSIKSSHYKTTSLNSISFQYPRSHISTFTITGIMQTENRVTISRVVRVRETGTAGQTRAAQAQHTAGSIPNNFSREQKLRQNRQLATGPGWSRQVWLLTAAL